MKDNVLQDSEIVTALELVERINNIFAQRIIGQTGLRDRLTQTMLAGGHILIESVPGLAKTTAAHTLAQAVSGSFHRIQCTPDLMPNDIVGTQIYNQATAEFTTELGPVHANFVLLDEINRSSAKTQSAMLEAMQEKQTTIGGQNYPLPDQFMVTATQNPIEEEGTYVLPEAQMDRFLLKVVLQYPTPEEEFEVLLLHEQERFSAPIEGHALDLEDLKTLQNLTRRVYIHPAVRSYIIDIIATTRGMGPNPIAGWNKRVRVGASPRGAIALQQVAKARALCAGRSFVTPDDVREISQDALRHRLIRTWDAVAEDVSVSSLIDNVFSVVPVP